MTDNTRMVDLPWNDGTTRTVPEWTAYEAESGLVFAARDGGYGDGLTPEKPWGQCTHRHSDKSVAVRIFTEAPEPPVKVDVPTGLAAVVSLSIFPDSPGYVLTRNGWRGLRTDLTIDSSQIANELRDGARVLYEGVGK